MNAYLSVSSPSHHTGTHIFYGLVQLFVYLEPHPGLGHTRVMSLTVLRPTRLTTLKSK